MEPVFFISHKCQASGLLGLNCFFMTMLFTLAIFYNFEFAQSGGCLLAFPLSLVGLSSGLTAQPNSRRFRHRRTADQTPEPSPSLHPDHSAMFSIFVTSSGGLVSKTFIRVRLAVEKHANRIQVTADGSQKSQIHRCPASPKGFDATGSAETNWAKVARLCCIYAREDKRMAAMQARVSAFSRRMCRLLCFRAGDVLPYAPCVANADISAQRYGDGWRAGARDCRTNSFCSPL